MLTYFILFIILSINYLIFSLFNSKWHVRGYKMLIPNAFEGLVNGLIVVIIQLVARNIFHLNNLYLILCLFAFIVIRNWNVFLFAILVPLITYWIIYNKFINTYILILFLNIFLLLSFEIIKRVMSKKYSMKIFLIPCSVIVLIISIIMSKYLFGTSLWDLNIINYVVPLLFSFVFFIIYSFLISFWLSANSLIDVNLYDFNTFYRIKSSEKALGLFLKNNKIENGLFVVFSFQKYLINKNLFSKDAILRKVENGFAKFNPLYFKISKDEYGIFFSLYNVPDIKYSIEGNSSWSRNKSDFLKDIERSIKKFNKEVGFNFQFGCSIYGTQVFGFHEGYKKAKFALNSSKITSQNIVSLFNPNYYNKYKFDISSIKELNKNMQIKNIYTTFQISVNKKGIQQPLYYAKPNVSSFDNLDTDEMIKYSKTLGTYDILTRYLAAESIKNFDRSLLMRNARILFKYSPSLISSENFNPYVFIKIINSHNIKTTNIIIYFELDEVVKYFGSFLFQNNMKILKDHYINIGVNNIKLTTKNKKILGILNPDYICIDKRYFRYKKEADDLKKIIKLSNKLGCKSVVFDISNKNELKNIIIHDIDILGGKYIHEGFIIPRILTKIEKENIERKIYA